jgi:hypothetical protein
MGIESLLNRSAVILIVSLLFAGFSWAGPQHIRSRRAFVGAQPQPYYYQNIYQRWPSYPPVVVISPYGPSYYLPPAVVVTAPFYCTFDNHGFVSRIGLLDHLSGMHKIPLETAAEICPGDSGVCVFPSY